MYSQIAAHAALMPLRVENAVVAEGQPAGLDVDAVFDGESGVEHVYFMEASPNTRLPW